MNELTTITSVARREAPLICRWSVEPATGRLICRWTTRQTGREAAPEVPLRRAA